MNSFRRAFLKVRKFRPPAILLILAAAFFIRGAPEPRGEHVLPPGVLAELFPGAESFARDGGLYRAECADGRVIGYAAAGPPPGRGITGYAGGVPFAAVFTPDMRVKRVKMLDSRETPGYAERVSERLGDAWTGLSPAEAAAEKVDAVTGATQTSEALIDGVGKTMAEISGDASAPLTRAPGGLGRAAAAAVAVYLAAALWSFFSRGAAPRTKIFLEAAGVLVPGLLAASMLSLAVLESWLSGFFSPGRHWLLMLTALFAAGIPLLRGRNFYCLHFCPFGRAQDLAGRVNRRKINPGRKAYRAARASRVLIILAALSLFAAGAGGVFHLFEPFAAFRPRHAHPFTLALAGVFLVLSAWIPRPWCRLCPTGGILDGLKWSRRRR